MMASVGMYQPAKSSVWQKTPFTVRKRAIKRRIYTVLSFALCIVLWSSLKSMNSESTQDNDDIAITPILSRISPKEFRIRSFSDLDSSAEKHQQQKPLDTVATHDIPPASRHSLAGTSLETRQVLPNDFKNQVSENVTPDEPDDGEETALKGIAVSADGKERGAIAGATSADMSQKQLLHSFEDSTKDRKSRKLPKKHGNSKRTSFPTRSEYLALDLLADTLPDVIHIPFEESTSDVTLQGWEDQWFSHGEYDSDKWGKLQEPKIDFIYTWVNGSDKAFQDTIAPYELSSTLNDPEGKWLNSHRINRYRDWDELRYSIRTVENYAGHFRNKIQILVNAVGPEGVAATATPENPSKITGKQRPLWMNLDNRETAGIVQILAQEDFFSESEHGCLPTFNSLTIENQIYNTKSNVDRFFAMSDDMLLGKHHSSSDLYSPLFGPTMGFKTNAYNTREPPTDLDARRFGEKPYLIYTSWLLNRRFGERKRKGQVHFGHSLSRSVTREAIKSFPRPALQSSCQRFRGETGFQLYSWYVAFHYTIERQREALLWSYIMLRSDTNQDGNLGWLERQAVMAELEEGMANEANTTFRTRIFYQVSELLEAAGLEPPKVNLDILWTSLDGPAAIRDTECHEFNVNECMAPGFSTSSSDEHYINPVFSAASILDRVARQHPKCGDCLLKLILNRSARGYSPLLPDGDKQPSLRATVIKALLKYQYTIIEPDALFVMVTDAEQVKHVLLKRLVDGKKDVGQICLNDDVAADDKRAIEDLRETMLKFFKRIAPSKSVFEH